MPIISAKSLDRLADRYDSAALLLELLNRLVSATASSVEKVHFPSGKSINQPGWDGYVQAESSQECYLPSGFSVWEVSTAARVYPKGKGDFDNRLKRLRSSEGNLPYGFKREDTTYVTVTLREWTEKHLKGKGRDGFLTYAKGKNFWKDVRVIDAQGLADWVKGKFAIESWLAEILGIPGDFPERAESAWSYWKDRCEYPITPEMLLLDRDDATQEIRAVLSRSSGITVVKGDSPDEAQAFIIASFLSLRDPDVVKDFFISRAFVVNDEPMAEYLAEARGGFILILRDKAADYAGTLEKKGYLVFVPIGNSIEGGRDPVILKRQYRSSFVKGLESVGIANAEAEQMARRCGSSITVFVRHFPSATLKKPEWAAPESIQHIIPAILVGRWDEAINGEGKGVFEDRELLERLAKHPYAQYRGFLQPYFLVDDPPMRRAGSVVFLTAPPDAFSLGEPSFTPDVLFRFGECAKEVFSESDPFLDLTPQERLTAQFQGVKRRYSDWLRDYLAETLLLTAAIGDEKKVPGALWGKRFPEKLFYELLRLNAEPTFIANLGSQLPALMEAAPTPFLETLERILQRNPNASRTIFFKDSSDDMSPWGSHSPHTYLLWGLETLAWSPEYFPRASLILAGLASVDPGGRLANRPLHSLREIFLSWKPGTNAPVPARQRVFDQICERYPDVGWKLCVSLLPSHYEISHPTSDPKWHDYGRSEKETVTHALVFAQYCFFLERAVSLAAADPVRWTYVLHTLHNYPPDKQSDIVETLKATTFACSDPRVKRDFREILREFVTRQNSFKDAEWSLKGSVLNDLRRLEEELVPEDPLLAYKWLFADPLPDIGSQRKLSDEYNNELSEKRLNALEEIHRASGTEGILGLAREISHQGLLASPWVEIAKTPEAVLGIIETLASESQRFQLLISCVSGLAFSKFGKDWVENIRELAEGGRFPKEVCIYCALGWPDDDDTFAFITSLGEDAERRYWDIRPAWTQARDARILAFIIDHLLEAGRVIGALNAAATLHRDVHIETELMVRLLNLTPEALAKEKGQRIDTMTVSSIKELFDAVRKRTAVDRFEIAKAEYPLLPLLIDPWDGRHLVLHEMLSEDPRFFIEIICEVYKPASAEKETVIDDDRRLRVQYGYKLLESWKTMPGIDNEGTIDEAKLKQWVTKARGLAAENDRVSITDQEIGRILAYAPNDPVDGAWPHRVVRNILESLGNEIIKSGLTIAIHNNQGVFTKEVFEGGKQERTLAEQWRGWASVVRNHWPYTGGILTNIAEDFERGGKRADDDADENRIRFQ